MERLDVAKLAAELDQMRAKDAIVALLYDYCHELDYLRPSEVVALFTPDAELDIRMDNAVVAEGTSYDRGVVHRGQDQINAFYRAITVRDSSYPAPYHHLVINPRVVVSGDAASAESTMVVVDNDPTDKRPHIMNGRPDITGYGRYSDKLVRTPAGDWKIAYRLIEVEAGVTARPELEGGTV